MNRYHYYTILLLYILACILLAPVHANSSDKLDFDSIWDDFLEAGQYYTMVDNAGNVIMQTGRRISVDDEYQTGDNTFYRVITVNDEERIAYAELIEELDIQPTPLNELREQLGLAVATAQDSEERGLIAAYHTHNAESYVPTDGTDSINGKGGIHYVGREFANSLEGLGVEVNYSEELHLPHDRGAYRRSRETVLELLASDPDAIFDVHRDAAPQGAYAIQLDVEDEYVTSIMFVVGRQNQNLGVNREYAQSLKSIADDVYPGLVKGIFYGGGNYNQDLSPLSMLLEVGAHTNSREAAERGIGLFAEVVDFYFYGPAEAAGGDSEIDQAASRSVFGLILFILAGVIVFYVINAGSWRAAWERFRHLFKKSRDLR